MPNNSQLGEKLEEKTDDKDKMTFSSSTETILKFSTSKMSLNYDDSDDSDDSMSDNDDDFTRDIF